MAASASAMTASVVPSPGSKNLVVGTWALVPLRPEGAWRIGSRSEAEAWLFGTWDVGLEGKCLFGLFLRVLKVKVADKLTTPCNVRAFTDSRRRVSSRSAKRRWQMPPTPR